MLAIELSLGTPQGSKLNDEALSSIAFIQMEGLADHEEALMQIQRTLETLHEASTAAWRSQNKMYRGCGGLMQNLLAIPALAASADRLSASLAILCRLFVKHGRPCVRQLIAAPVRSFPSGFPVLPVAVVCVALGVIGAGPCARLGCIGPPCSVA